MPCLEILSVVKYRVLAVWLGSDVLVCWPCCWIHAFVLCVHVAWFGAIAAALQRTQGAGCFVYQRNPLPMLTARCSSRWVLVLSACEPIFRGGMPFSSASAPMRKRLPGCQVFLRSSFFRARGGGGGFKYWVHRVSQQALHGSLTKTWEAVQILRRPRQQIGWPTTEFS